MGSEGPTGVTINITGFKKFHGVAENPTEKMANKLKEYLAKNSQSKDVVLGSCTVLETAGQGALASLYQLLQSAINTKESCGKTIWVHFGVNSGATKFAIEQQAVNEATFRCPDELGWKPQVFVSLCYVYRLANLYKRTIFKESKLLLIKSPITREKFSPIR